MRKKKERKNRKRIVHLLIPFLSVEVGVVVFEGHNCTGRSETIMHFQCRFPCYGITNARSVLLRARGIGARGRKWSNVAAKGLDVTVYRRTCADEDNALLSHRIPEGETSSCLDFPDDVAGLADCLQPVHLEVCDETWRDAERMRAAVLGTANVGGEVVNWHNVGPGLEPQWYKDHLRAAKAAAAGRQQPGQQGADAEAEASKRKGGAAGAAANAASIGNNRYGWGLKQEAYEAGYQQPDSRELLRQERERQRQRQRVQGNLPQPEDRQRQRQREEQRLREQHMAQKQQWEQDQRQQQHRQQLQQQWSGLRKRRIDVGGDGGISPLDWPAEPRPMHYRDPGHALLSDANEARREKESVGMPRFGWEAAYKYKRLSKDEWFLRESRKDARVHEREMWEEEFRRGRGMGGRKGEAALSPFIGD